MRGEFDWIEELRRRVSAQTGKTGKTGRGSVRVGIGDDCAVVSVPADAELLLTTDLLVEGVHFVMAGLRPEDLGWKALAVSISDVAAMGGVAAHAVVSVGIRSEHTGAFADGLLSGLLACADHYGVSLVGGDTTGTPGPVIVNVALTGFAPRGRAVLRSGARPGDAICVTGALGGSILGRHLRVEPRQDEALTLVQENDVHAMIDVSDGLSSDLGHIVDLSGVGAEVFDDRVPIHDDARALAAKDGRSAIEHALADGEDFELLFTLSHDAAVRLERDGLCGTRVARIGRIVEDRRYVRVSKEGADDARTMERKGYDHFRGA